MSLALGRFNACQVRPPLRPVAIVPYEDDIDTSTVRQLTRFMVRRFSFLPEMTAPTLSPGLPQKLNEIPRHDPLDVVVRVPAFGQKGGEGLQVGDRVQIHRRLLGAVAAIEIRADPDVIRDLNEFFGRLVRERETWYRHTSEGPDDMPAHIRAALTQTQISVPVRDGRMTLGTWQGIYVFEHRSAGHMRSVALHLFGE